MIPASPTQCLGFEVGFYLTCIAFYQKKKNIYQAGDAEQVPRGEADQRREGKSEGGIGSQEFDQSSKNTPLSFITVLLF